MSEYDSNNPPWMKQPGESGLAYRRFSIFRLLGPARTVRRAFIEDVRSKGKDTSRYDKSGAPIKWIEQSKAFDWESRAAAFDQSLIDEQEALVRERMRVAWEVRQTRREVAMEKLYEMIDAMDPALVELKAGDLFRSVALLNADQRSDLEERVEKKEKAKRGDQIGEGLSNLAQIVLLAQSLREVPAPTIREEPAKHQIEPGESENIIEGDFREKVENSTVESLREKP